MTSDILLAMNDQQLMYYNSWISITDRNIIKWFHKKFDALINHIAVQLGADPNIYTQTHFVDKTLETIKNQFGNS